MSTFLCKASSFFKAAFTRDVNGNSHKTMGLPEDNENTCSLFIDWLYHQRYEILPLPDHDDEDSDYEKDDVDKVGKDDDRYISAFTLFVFAEKYDVPDLKWLLTKTLFADAATCRKGPSNASIDYLYRHTAQSAGIRRLVADWHAWRMDPEYFEGQNFQALLKKHPEFSADIKLSYGKNLEREANYDPFEGAMPDEYKDQ